VNPISGGLDFLESFYWGSIPIGCLFSMNIQIDQSCWPLWGQPKLCVFSKYVLRRDYIVFLVVEAVVVVVEEEGEEKEKEKSYDGFVTILGRIILSAAFSCSTVGSGGFDDACNCHATSWTAGSSGV
jgi:hypothetical protein